MPLSLAEEDKRWHELILAHESDLNEFFDSLFSFLRRRTDFYHVADPASGKPGLPPGEANVKLLKYYDKHALLHAQFQNLKNLPANEQARKSDRIQKIAESLQPVSIDVEFNKVHPESQCPETIDSYDTENYSTPPPRRTVADSPSAAEAGERFGVLREPVFPVTNGGKGDRYYWSQNQNSLTLQIPLEVAVSQAAVVVRIGADYLLCSVATERFGPLKKTWTAACKPDASTWYLTTSRDADYVQRQCLIIEVEKERADWWPKPFVEEELGLEPVREFRADPVPLSSLEPGMQVSVHRVSH